MRVAEGKAASQQLALIAIERAQFHVRDSMFAQPAIPHPEKVDLPRLSGEMSCRAGFMRPKPDERLPAGSHRPELYHRACH
jgi:hypothetical protein